MDDAIRTDTTREGVVNREAIARLSGFGFEAKKWTATGLIAATFGATATSSSQIYLAALPAIILFMYIDAYYLAAERSFRSNSESGSPRRVSVGGLGRALMSFAILPFYVLASICVLALAWMSL